MRFIPGTSAAEFSQWAVSAGLPAYRGRQIAEWIYTKLTDDPEEMTSLPRELRQKLARDFVSPALTEIDCTSSRDGVIKPLLRLHDGEAVEMAVIPTDERITLCLSTQVGCAVGCRFCASGANGLKRNLTSGEMLAEFLYGCRLAGRRCDNIVFMGIGEGMMNFAELSVALEKLTSPEFFNLSPRRITVSTSGFVPGMLKFAELKKEYTLAISLHAPDDLTRAKLIPDNCRYPISEILAAADLCRRNSGRDYTLEYTMVAGINDSLEAAAALGSIAKRHHAKVNLIPYNETGNSGEFRRPPKLRIEEFHRAVAAAGARVTRRVERGSGKAAACGQLRIQHLSASEKENSK